MYPGAPANLYIPQERTRVNGTVKSTLPNKTERSMGLLHYYKCQHTIRGQFMYAKCFTELEWNLQFLTGDLLKYTTPSVIRVLKKFTAHLRSLNINAIYALLHITTALESIHIQPVISDLHADWKSEGDSVLINWKKRQQSDFSILVLFIKCVKLTKKMICTERCCDSGHVVSLICIKC